MKLSVVIYCHNVGESLERFHVSLSNSVKLLREDYELIYINDGSEDDTLLALQVVSTHSGHVKYVSFSRHFGREGAICAGLEHAKGDAVVLMDGNFSHPTNVILDLFDEFKKGYHQVVATKKLESSSLKKVKRNFKEKVINKLIDQEIQKQAESDFRLLSRKAVNALLSMPESNRYSKGFYHWIGFKVKTIEYEVTSRVVNKVEESKRLDLLKNGLELIFSYNTRPLRFLSKLGLGLISIGLIIFVLMSFKVLLVGVRIPGLYTISNLIMLFGGVQLLMIGVVGEYVGKAYYETKRRPQYIIESSSYDEE